MAQLVFGLQKSKIMRDVCADASFPDFLPQKQRLGPIDGPMAKFCTFLIPFAFFLNRTNVPLIPFMFLLMSF